MKEVVTFTYEIKDELSSIEWNKTESFSFLVAFIKLNGTIKFSSEGSKLILKTENAPAAKCIYKIIKKYFDYLDINFSFVKTMKLYKKTEYLVNVKNGVDKLFNELGFDLLDSKIPYELQNKEDKIRAYLAGTFIASGSCNDPRSTNYHLEFSTSDEKYAESLMRMVGKIKTANFDFKKIQRRNRVVIYLKKSDQISDFLAFINADNACINFENIRIDRDFSNTNNRLVNCDTYNYNKSLNNSLQQIELIKKVDKYVGISNLTNEKLRSLCFARLDNPEATYSDLAIIVSEQLQTNVSKSNVNHLFIKLKKEYGEKVDAKD